MYTYDEVMAASLDYFGGNDLAANVFVTKYALRNEVDELVEKTPDDMHRRMAQEFARIERDKYCKPLNEEMIYQWLRGFKKIIPQGSPMYGIGNHKAVSLSNCFVIESTYDSYGGIFYTDEHIAQISKRRGGVGYDISYLRPEDMAVNNSARTTTGATSFMHRFSHTGNEVGQHGRRGAQMISISVHHPSIERFVTIKNDGKSITGANISVRLTDEFLTAVKNDTEYELRWPVEGHPQVSRMVSARKIWNLIIHSAWFRAEPGLLFWDNILRESPADCYEGFQTISTNPCITRDNLIATTKGLFLVDELVSNKQSIPLLIDNKVYYSDAGFFSKGIKNVILLEFESGRTMKLTPDHKLMTTNGWKSAGNLDHSDEVILHNHRNNSALNIDNKQDFARGYCLGSFLGDGNISDGTAQLKWWGINRQDYRLDAINLLKDAGWYSNHHSDASSSITTYTAIKSKQLYDFAVDKQCILKDSKTLSIQAMSGSWSYLSGLIAGYFDADGTVLFNPAKGSSLRISSSNIHNLKMLQLGLNGFGIYSKIYKDRREPGWKTMPDGQGGSKEYYCQAQHELVISCDNIIEFEKWVKIRNINKLDKIRNIIDNYKRIPNRTHFVDTVISKKTIGKEEVFDCIVPGINSFDANGIYTHNCGEIPLSAYDSCRLMAINIFHCVDDPFTYKAKFDTEKMFQAAYITQRLMDDLVDLEIEKINQIIQKVKSDPQPQFIKACELHLWQEVLAAAERGRRTGTGLTALGDTIAAMGLKYGSPRSIEVVDEIYKTMKLGCYRASVDMAEELGPFAGYDSEAEKDCPFIQRIAEQDPKLYQDMCKYGRRNIACLTSAPTGSVSMVAKITNYNGTSSGIEPMYDISTIRRRRINNNDEGLEGTFTDDLGETWAEYEVFHPGVQAWMDANPDKDLEDCPYTGSTAADISWTQRVKLQAAAQKHVDHAISSTINLPKDVKEEEVAKIYETAWEAGLKGVTVYRDGCRSGIIIKKEEQQQPMPEDRPRKLPCDVHHITVRGQQYFILVGLHDGQPYEVFAGKNGFLPKKIKTGTIIRKRKNFYKAVFDGADEELSPITMATDEMEEVITRLTSGLLRTGANMHFIVQQLEKVGERQTDMNSFARSVARALKKYIPDGTKEGSVCAECGADAVVREEGCVICKSCGVGKCL